MNYIPLAISAIVTAGIAWALHSLDVYRLEDNHRAELSELTGKLKAQCEQDKEITAHASQDYQQKITSLNAQLAKLRLRPATCIPVSTLQPSSIPNGANSAGINARPHGINDSALYEYAGDCEQYRLKTIGLQDFIHQVWERK